METDRNGCSTCEPGEERFEPFRSGGRTFIQYEYRTPAGDLFSCVAPSLKLARRKRQIWESQSHGK